MLLVQKEFPWLNFGWLAKKLEKIFLVTIVLFFFFVFPIILLHISLTSYFGAKEADLRENTIAYIDNELSKINEYSNTRIYYHNLFSKISKFAQLSKSPEDYLLVNFANLKNNYPGEISFIAWDKNGKTIDSLTDWPGYTYAFEKLYVVLKEITQLSISNQELNIDKLKIVKDNSKILNNVFGNTFLAKNLKYPLGKGIDAGPFMVDTSLSLSYAWYAVGEKVSFVTFISKSLLSDYAGLKKIIENSNKIQNNCIFGFFLTSDFDTPQTDFPDMYIGSLKLAAALFESVGESVYEDNKVIIKFCSNEPSVRTFACSYKTDGYWKKDWNIRFWMIVWISGLFLLYILCGYMFYIKHIFVSLRWKIIALILFVNLVPSIVVGCIAFDFLHNKKLDLRQELLNDITSELRSIDAKCNDYLKDFENRIQNDFMTLKNNFSDKGLEKNNFEAFAKTVNKYLDTNIMVVASDSRLVFLDNRNKVFDKSLIKGFCNSLLSFSNNLPNPKSIIGDAFRPENCEFVRNINANKGKIVPLALDFFVSPGLCFVDFVKDKDDNYDYCVFIFWNSYDFQKQLISEHYKSLKSNADIEQLGFCYMQNDYLISDISFNTDFLKNAKNKKKHLCEAIDTIDNKNYLLVGLNSCLKNWKIIGACSEKSIETENLYFIINIIIVIISSFIICLAFAYIIFIHFLHPIHNLNNALLALKEGDFGYKIESVEEDEFGYLEKILNRILVSFGELKIAQDFQKALAPKNNNFGPLDIFGKTEIMTTMGGDYYDSFIINEEYAGIIIGDVAGHGVAAGLIMAMAKAGVLTSDEDVKLNPAKMLSRLNDILISVNCRSLKRMMTMQYFVINVKTGSGVYTNAGHCYPLIFDKAVKTVRELDSTGLPLGIKRNLTLKNNEFILNNNETLVLYTDGSFEFTDNNNEKFKFDKLKEMLVDSYNDYAEVFYHNLYDSISKRRIGELEDDTTIVIVNWGQK